MHSFDYCLIKCSYLVCSDSSLININIPLAANEMCLSPYFTQICNMNRCVGRALKPQHTISCTTIFHAALYVVTDSSAGVPAFLGLEAWFVPVDTISTTVYFSGQLE